MKKIILTTFMLCGLSFAHADAQQLAVTDNGRRVILYEDGTWEYYRERPWRDDRFSQRDFSIHIDPTGSGYNTVITVDNEVTFELEKGFLRDYSVLRGGRRSYDHHGRVDRIGAYRIEYDFSTGRVTRVGRYVIEYDFISERVKRIGSHPIEYDFMTERVARIGNTRLRYSIFNEKVPEVVGETRGLRIHIY